MYNYLTDIKEKATMNLYKILLRHCSQKDKVKVIKSYVFANNEYELMVRLDQEYNYGLWKDSQEDGDEFKVYNDDYDVIGTETRFEKMLRLRGDFNDPNADYSDGYYGITHYGWSEVQEISNEQAQILLDLNIAHDWR